MASRLITARCVPDIYLTEERLQLLFNDFNIGILQPGSSDAVFADLVNHVRQPYISQILSLQQSLISATTAAHGPQLRTLYENDSSKHAQELAVLQERHDQQVRQMRLEHEQERAVLEKHIPREWVVGIDVIYGDAESQKPSSRIRELNDRGDSINYAHGGKYHVPYVWLVPRMSTTSTGALTRVDIDLQEKGDAKKMPLEKGTGGKYRYLCFETAGAGGKIYSVNLMRLGHAMQGAPDGYQGSTRDLNMERTGGYLYLVWKSHCVE